MNKILVEVNIPAISTSYDVFISQTAPMYEILELLKRAINGLAKGQFVASSNSILCFGESGSIVNINMSAYELGLRNGSRLMLI